MIFIPVPKGSIIFMPVPKGGRNRLAQFLLPTAPVSIEIQRKCNQHKEE